MFTDSYKLGMHPTHSSQVTPHHYPFEGRYLPLHAAAAPSLTSAGGFSGGAYAADLLQSVATAIDAARYGNL